MSDTADITKEEIADALYRVLRSRGVANAPRMRRLITYIVLEAIHDRSCSLKGYAIGVEVFDRGEEFDPDRDSIVRVQMGRLRTLLEQYYLTEGKADPIVISVPKGTYVPLFKRNSQMVISEPAQAKKPSFAEQKNHLPWMLTLFFAGLLGLWAYYNFAPYPPPQTAARSTSPMTAEPLQGPVVAVFPFRDLSIKKKFDHLRKAMAIDLISNLSRFRTLHVLSPDVTVFAHKPADNPLTAGRKLQSQYVLSGTITEKDNSLKISTHLQSSVTGHVIWMHDYVWNEKQQEQHKIQNTIARDVASRLGQPYGVINRQQRKLVNHNPELSSEAYQCMMQFFNYKQESNPANHRSTRDCLEKVVHEHPQHAQAWAALSWLHADEHRQGFNLRHADTPALDRALAAARMAVKLDPDDAFTHRRLANIHFIRGDQALARNEIMEALALNPNSPDVLANVGWVLTNTGEWEEAFDYAQKAIALNPGHPPWYMQTPFLYFYRKGDCQQSINTAKAFFRSRSTILLPHIYLAALSSHCRGKIDASSNVEVINGLYPEFLKSPTKKLKELSVPDELIGTMLKDLKAAGVHLETEN